MRALRAGSKIIIECHSDDYA